MGMRQVTKEATHSGATEGTEAKAEPEEVDLDDDGGAGAAGTTIRSPAAIPHKGLRKRFFLFPLSCFVLKIVSLRFSFI